MHPKIELYEELNKRSYHAAKRRAFWQTHFDYGLRPHNMEKVHIEDYVDCIVARPEYSLRVVRNRLDIVANNLGQ
jgi:hypothetical protein